MASSLPNGSGRMLRTIFVLVIAAVGAVYAFQGAFYGLLFYLWVAYFRPEQWVWNDFIKNLNLSYIAGICVVASTFVSRERWPFNLRVGVLALFVLQTLLSVLFAARPDLAWSNWYDFVKISVIGYLIVVLVTDTSRFRIVLLVIALSLAFEGAKQGWLELLRHPGGLNNNPLPNFGDNNGVAAGMTMLVPLLTALAATAERRWERMAHYLLAFGVLYRGVSTYSRGGVLAALALGLVYVLRSSRRAIALVGIVIAMVIVVPAMPDAFWQRMQTITTSTTEAEQVSANDDTSAASRLHFWSVAVSMANANPLTGVGYNLFNATYDRYDDLGGLFGHDRSVHSTWFGLLAELGYPGLLLFIAQLVLAFRACWRARKAARIGPQYASLGAFAFGLEASLVAFCVGGTFLPFQYTEMLWHLLALSTALHLIAEQALASQTADAHLRSASARWTADHSRPAMA